MKHYAYNSPFKMKDDDGNEYTLTVDYDECAMDPREWDNLCTMVCWHSRYGLGDKHQYDDADEFFESLLCEVCGLDIADIEILPTRDKYKLALESDKLYIKEINMYEHSGITVSTSKGYPYNDRWDSCCIGFIYVTKERMFKECMNVTEENWKEKADEYIEGEMETYDQYVRGKVYWFRLTKKVIQQDKCPHCGEVIKEYEVEEMVDSCGGFYGDCLEENGILDNIGSDIKFVED
jgi:hypothetical protein